MEFKNTAEVFAMAEAMRQNLGVKMSGIDSKGTK
jgi:hypothetical protein